MFSVSLQYIKESKLRERASQKQQQKAWCSVMQTFFHSFLYSIKYLLGAPVTKLRPLAQLCKQFCIDVQRGSWLLHTDVQSPRFSLPARARPNSSLRVSKKTFPRADVQRAGPRCRRAGPSQGPVQISKGSRSPVQASKEATSPRPAPTQCSETTTQDLIGLQAAPLCTAQRPGSGFRRRQQLGPRVQT